MRIYAKLIFRWTIRMEDITFCLCLRFVFGFFFFFSFLAHRNGPFSNGRTWTMNVLVIFSQNSIRPINFPPISISYELIVVFCFDINSLPIQPGQMSVVVKHFSRALFKTFEYPKSRLYFKRSSSEFVYGIVFACLRVYVFAFVCSCSFCHSLSHTHTVISASFEINFIAVSLSLSRSTLFIVRYIIRYH